MTRDWPAALRVRAAKSKTRFGRADAGADAVALDHKGVVVVAALEARDLLLARGAVVGVAHVVGVEHLAFPNAR